MLKKAKLHFTQNFTIIAGLIYFVFFTIFFFKNYPNPPSEFVDNVNTIIPLFSIASTLLLQYSNVQINNFNKKILIVLFVTTNIVFFFDSLISDSNPILKTISTYVLSATSICLIFSIISLLAMLLVEKLWVPQTTQIERNVRKLIRKIKKDDASLPEVKKVTETIDEWLQNNIKNRNPVQYEIYIYLYTRDL